MSAKLANSERDNAYQRELSRLRELVLGDDYQQAVEKIVAQGFTQRVAAVIVDAIVERNQQSGEMGPALAPVIAPALRQSIKNDPHSIVDIIFPIIGPSIRKAVANAVMDALLSLNDLVERSVGLNSLRWRYEAWRKGQKYSHYVLSRNLLWRVDQVFLINKNSGILMASVSNAHYREEDPDLVSSMLSAINDFVVDSFQTEEGDGLERVRYGDRILQINVGQKSILALAITGMVSQDIKFHAMDILEKLERDYTTILDNFNGDKASMNPVLPLLTSCLIEKRQENESKRVPWIAIFLLTLPLLWLSLEFFRHQAKARALDDVLSSLAERPGTLVTDQRWEGGLAVLDILQDPLAGDIEAAYGAGGSSPVSLRFNITYANLDPKHIGLAYVNNAFDLPMPPRVNHTDDTLLLRGAIRPEVLKALKDDPRIHRFFSGINDSAVLPYPPSSASESAADKALRLINAINDTRLFFDVAQATLSRSEAQKLSTLSEQISALQDISRPVPDFIQQVLILGFADDSGTDAANVKISLERAENVATYLAARGLPEPRIVIQAMGHVDAPVLDIAKKRRVSVSLIHKPIREIPAL